ncbi:Rho termination factor N-terminal domain-containing protein [Algoriphagus aestuariicola]|uniref:Rho termination factor N-terminal domain-containing protein n=1 Tax=Algoriphagus aestuariicola TaxID=1852016 RepID=A0ABS3BVD9_9BACT|nr:Rho termination factor N-terminal domain-containing protein [Algoriphagus aestuariicola]MBN7803253.1 Rho termination factor N-terminal domain-containing protein [Algoriphagus aestuariicola]
MAKDHGPSIKDDAKYEALRREGVSKQKAARIANTPDAGERGGKAKDYEDRSKQELYEKAKQVGIPGRSKMTKSQLIHALRNN